MCNSLARIDHCNCCLYSESKRAFSDPVRGTSVLRTYYVPTHFDCSVAWLPNVAGKIVHAKESTEKGDVACRGVGGIDVIGRVEVRSEECILCARDSVQS